jgi:hypothetical protein
MSTVSKIKVRVIENSFLARIAAFKLQSSNVAMVLDGNILLHNVSKKDFLKNTDWLCHELQHVLQWHKNGVVGFLGKYVWYSIKYGYYNNPFEKDARQNATNIDLLEMFEIS